MYCEIMDGVLCVLELLELAGVDALYASMHAGGSGRCALFAGGAKGDALYAALYATLYAKGLGERTLCGGTAGDDALCP